MAKLLHINLKKMISLYDLYAVMILAVAILMLYWLSIVKGTLLSFTLSVGPDHMNISWNEIPIR